MTVAMGGVRDGEYRLSERGGGRASGWVRGRGGRELREKCGAPLGRHGNRPVDHVVSPCSAKASDNDAPSVCKKGFLGVRVG